MNIGLLLLFLLIQVIVNNVLGMFIDTSSLYGVLGFYLLSSLIISFVGAFLSTPPGYKKEFYRQPGFHKTMLIYFAIFFLMDLMLVFFF